MGLMFCEFCECTRYKSIYMHQTGQWTKPATCLLGWAKPSVFGKKLTDRKNELCHFVMWNLYTKCTCCSRHTIKDWKRTVQFNQWLTLWDQFTNNNVHMEEIIIISSMWTFSRPSRNSKQYQQNLKRVFLINQRVLLKVLGMPPYSSLVALQKKKQKSMQFINYFN